MLDAYYLESPRETQTSSSPLANRSAYGPAGFNQVVEFGCGMLLWPAGPRGAWNQVPTYFRFRGCDPLTPNRTCSVSARGSSCGLAVLFGSLPDLVVYAPGAPLPAHNVLDVVAPVSGDGHQGSDGVQARELARIPLSWGNPFAGCGRPVRKAGIVPGIISARSCQEIPVRLNRMSVSTDSCGFFSTSAPLHFPPVPSRSFPLSGRIAGSLSGLSPAN